MSSLAEMLEGLSDNIANMQKMVCERSYKTVTIPKEAKNIGDYAFAGCKQLEKISFLEKPDSIGNYVFIDCPNLETIDAPWMNGALDNFSNQIPSGVTVNYLGTRLNFTFKIDTEQTNYDYFDIIGSSQIDHVTVDRYFNQGNTTYEIHLWVDSQETKEIKPTGTWHYALLDPSDTSELIEFAADSHAMEKRIYENALSNWDEFYPTIPILAACERAFPYTITDTHTKYSLDYSGASIYIREDTNIRKGYRVTYKFSMSLLAAGTNPIPYEGVSFGLSYNDTDRQEFTTITEYDFEYSDYNNNILTYIGPPSIEEGNDTWPYRGEPCEPFVRQAIEKRQEENTMSPALLYAYEKLQSYIDFTTGSKQQIMYNNSPIWLH